jgi:hypothetical protein
MCNSSGISNVRTMLPTFAHMQCTCVDDHPSDAASSVMGFHTHSRSALVLKERPSWRFGLSPDFPVSFSRDDLQVTPAYRHSQGKPHGWDPHPFPPGDPFHHIPFRDPASLCRIFNHPTRRPSNRFGSVVRNIPCSTRRNCRTGSSRPGWTCLCHPQAGHRTMHAKYFICPASAGRVTCMDMDENRASRGSIDMGYHEATATDARPYRLPREDRG